MTESSCPASRGQVSLAVPMRQTEANLRGNIHGGEIVKVADTAAGGAAQRFCGGPVVTAAIDEMAFLHAVRVGDVLHVDARVTWAGRSSLEVEVRVETEPLNGMQERIAVAGAHFVMVAVDARGEIARVPTLVAESPEERRRRDQAEVRRRRRLAHRETRGES